MDRNFYDNDEFEDILKQKADQYKMYPSDRVWNNIYSALHGRKRWIALGFVLFFLGSSLLIGKQFLPVTNSKLTAGNKKAPVSTSAVNRIVANHINGNRFNKQHVLILATRIKPADNNTTVNQSSLEPVAVINNNADRVSSVANNDLTRNNEIIIAEKEPLVIENNLLGTEKNKQTADIKNIAPEKNESSNKNISKKVTDAKENKTVARLQNNIATVDPFKESKWFVQYYASPIISYRRLSSQNPPVVTAPVSAGTGNVNQYVNHQPAPGFEAGTKIQYRLSNSLSVFAGAQINYSRYYIDAYKYHYEKASIALDGKAADTISRYTDIRNFSGYQPEQLQNQYWQLSVPIGIEIKLLGDKKLQLNVSGGFQPTVLLHSNSYLITSDYKNYIQSPDLARTFNVHTNFEAFVSYQTHGLRLQLGPQFRSQLLSSYSNQYRVREYLTEYGIKFGITKAIK